MRKLITLNELQVIIKKLNDHIQTVLEWEDVNMICFRVDMFSYGDKKEWNRHIDIDFIFGDYVELHENEELYSYIFHLCDLQLLEIKRETEVVLYEKD